MTGHRLKVRWKPGIDEDRKEIRWLKAGFLPELLGHDAVTMYRTVRCVKDIDHCSMRLIRHELHHIWQQMQWVPWFPWLGSTLFGLWYFVNPWFRKRIEAEAEAQGLEEYPQVRVVGRVS